MRTEKEIRRRLQQRRYRHQKKYLEAVLGRAHSNCRFNARAGEEGPGRGVCTHPEIVQQGSFDVPLGALIAKRPETVLPICDSRVLRDRAKNCEKFEARLGKDQAKSDFRTILREASQNMDRFAGLWPDIAQLIWAMGDPSTVLPEVIEGTLGVSPEEVEENEKVDLELQPPPGTVLRIGEAPETLESPEPQDLAVPEDPPEEPSGGWYVGLLRWLLKRADQGD